MLKIPDMVRPAKPEDVPDVVNLMRALAEFEDYIDDFRVDEQTLLDRAFGSEAQCRILVAEWAGRIAGYGVVLMIPFTFDLRPTMILKELYIGEAFRGRGLGHALLQRFAIMALESDAGRIKWDVLVGNRYAEAFYQKVGGFPDSKWVPYQMGRQGIEQLAVGVKHPTAALADAHLHADYETPQGDGSCL